MGLPRITKQTLESYAVEIYRGQDKRESVLAKSGRDFDDLKSTNPELYHFLAGMVASLEENERGFYFTGFLQCYSLLQRQAEIDDLEGKTRSS